MAKARAKYRNITTGIALRTNENKLRITGERVIISDALKCEEIPIAANRMDYSVTMV